MPDAAGSSADDLMSPADAAASPPEGVGSPPEPGSAPEAPGIADGGTGADLADGEGHERLLFSIAYRMLGSVADAEDAVQTTLLRWTQADRTAIREPRAWLTSVLSRVCLDRLRAARRERERYTGPWLPEPIVVEDVDPAEEVALADSVSLAFLVVLESLTPAERVVFVLHDVFAFTFEEIAEMLGRAPAACRQLGSRARRRIAERRPRFSADPRTRQEVGEAFLAAAAGGDLEALMRLLAPDVVLHADGGGVVRAARRPIEGAEAVARFLSGLARKYADGLEVRLVTVNGGPGLVAWMHGHLDLVLAADVADGRVSAVHIVRNPHKLSGVRVRPPAGS